MTNVPTPLELAAITLALRSKHPWKIDLRAQVPFLRVKSRECFPTGFVTRFEKPDSGRSIEMISEGTEIEGYPPSVNAELAGTPGGLVTFVVWVGDDGYISELDVSSLSGHELPGLSLDAYQNFQDDQGGLVVPE